MLMPDKLLEKALYWGPLFTGVICLIAGMGVLNSPFMQKLSAHVEASRIERARLAGRPIPAPRYAAHIKDLNKLAKKERPYPKPVDKAVAARFDEGGRIAGFAGAVLADPHGYGEQAGLAFQQRFEVDGFAGLLGRAGRPGMEGVPLALLDGPRLLLRGDMADWASLEGHRWAQGEEGFNGVIAPVALWPLKESTRQSARALGKMEPSVEVAALGGTKAGAHYNGMFYGRLVGSRQGALAGRHFQSLQQQGASAGMIINFQELGQEFAFEPDIVLGGVAASQNLTGRILKREQGTLLGTALSQPFISYVSLGLGGLEGAARRYETQANSRPRLQKAAYNLPADLKGNAGGKACANHEFYRVLKYLQKSRLAPLKTTLKSLFNGQKNNASRWIFKPLSLRAKRACARWKVYRSGRRKCLKWGTRAPAANGLLSAGEKKVLQSASRLVSTGASAHIKKRSNNGWVLTRINQDLQFYSRQPEHPAICTGALRMVDYFDNHLGRVRRMIDDRLAELGNVQLLLQSRRSFLNDMLYRSRELAEIKRSLTGGETRLASFQGSSLKISPEGRAAAFSPRRGAFDEISLDEIRLDDLQSGIASLGRVVWGDVAGDEIAGAKGVLAGLRLAHKFYQEKNFQLELTPAVRRDVRRLFVLIEAGFYLKERHEMYKELNDQLFGSLALLRQAHALHCQCSNDAAN